MVIRKPVPISASSGTHHQCLSPENGSVRNAPTPARPPTSGTNDSCLCFGRACTKSATLATETHTNTAARIQPIVHHLIDVPSSGFAEYRLSPVLSLDTAKAPNYATDANRRIN